jgi:hypothetical protein
VRLFKCPFCSFRNIHEDIVTHHIQYKNDTHHNVDVGDLDKRTYIASVKEESKELEEESLPIPSIKCLWCNYRDKIERDLERHFLERHNYELIKITTYCERRTDKIWTGDPFSWMYSDSDYRLYKAMQLAKRECQGGVT